jgi:hypothetical protein
LPKGREISDPSPEQSEVSVPSSQREGSSHTPLLAYGQESSDPEPPPVPAQLVNDELPRGESEFPGHVRHVDSPTAPTAAEYIPRAQSSQASEPLLSLYFPAGQSVHVPPFGPDEPTLQVQSVLTTLPALESEFSGHVRHVDSAVAPVANEYFPILQSEHFIAPSVSLYLPAIHWLHVQLEYV